VNEFQDRRTIRQIVLNARTVAIVGLSASELRASNFVGYYLQRHGYRVIPVNPNEERILGQQVYPSLRDVPEHIDVVDVFRDPAAVPDIARKKKKKILKEMEMEKTKKKLGLELFTIKHT